MTEEQTPPRRAPWQETVALIAVLTAALFVAVALWLLSQLIGVDVGALGGLAFIFGGFFVAVLCLVAAV